MAGTIRRRQHAATTGSHFSRGLWDALIALDNWPSSSPLEAWRDCRAALKMTAETSD
jgi:hypothetical protein